MEILDEQIENAYLSWRQAMNFFENAVEKPDVEFAVFNMEAKRKQYLRLLNEKKKLSEQE